jgi:Skp family chaperone for outer membrane proteins
VHFRICLATVALMGICSASAMAQAPAANGQQPQQPQGPKTGPTSVALVDVGFLLKNHPTMNAEMEKIKSEMQAAQDQIEARRKELLSQSEAIGKNLESSSPEFKQKQEELLNAESKLRVDFMGKEKEFAERQAGVVYKSYQDITTAIGAVANHYKFDLVIRFSKEQNEMDYKKPRTVDIGIQRDVVYQAPGMDVTDIALYVLKNNVQATPAAVKPAVPQTAGRPGLGTQK